MTNATLDRFIYFLNARSWGTKFPDTRSPYPVSQKYHTYMVNLKWKMAEQEYNVYGEHLGV